MDARNALRELDDALADAESLIETLEPEDGGDRLQSYAIGEALKELSRLIDAGERIVDAENDIRTGNVAGAWPYDIAELAAVLGRDLEPHPDFGEEL